MPRREPTRSRRAPSRDPRRTFLIVIGAESTEKAYLEGLREHRGLATVRMRVEDKACAPDQLVEHARKLRTPDHDEVWAVTDVDHYEREGGKVTAAQAAARRARIRLAVSDPCFEIWLLLHHENCTAHLADYAAVLRRLRKAVPTYDKRNLRFGDFRAGIDDAIERARALPAGRNPSTSVGELVSALLEDR